jgi:PAS domain S-box-containing protein
MHRMTNYRVLLIEDDPADARLVKEWLASEGRHQILDADRLDDALSRLEKEVFDVALLDLGLPDSKGIETLLRVHEQVPTLPILVLTGLADQQMALAAIKNGAQDYMVKNEVHPALLARSIHFAVQRMRFEQILQRKNNELESSNRELQLLAYELRHTEERFRLVVEGAPNAIIAVDQGGRISLVNKQTEVLFGYQRHELVGQPLEVLVPSRFRPAHEGFRRQFQTSPQVRAMGTGRDLFALRKDGTEVPVEIALNPVTTREGLIVLASIIDITERKRAENLMARQKEELETTNKSLQREILERLTAQKEVAEGREEKLRMKGEFLSHVSHELRSPLAVVYQFTTILLDGLGGPLTSTQREYLDVSLRNVSQLKYMIDDLLDASRAETSKLIVKRSAISVLDVVEQSVLSQSAVGRAKNISIKTELATELPLVYADAARISQVMTNLLDNAIKFSPANTTVTVRAKLADNDQNMVCISVADCGCGIPTEHAERIFDRLYQLQTPLQAGRRGLGLGLYICKELVTLHGGWIWLDTSRKSGSTFYFTLPVFTIETTIRRVLVRDGAVVPAFALITAEIVPIKPWPNERERERLLNKVRQLLEHCIRPDVDVLLPAQHCPEGDLLSVLAVTDDNGSRALLARMNQQLSRSASLNVPGVKWSTSVELVDLQAIPPGLPIEEAVTALSSQLKERLKDKAKKVGVLQ